MLNGEKTTSEKKTGRGRGKTRAQEAGLESKTPDELQQLIADAQQMLELKAKSTRQEAKDEIRRIAKEHGLEVKIYVAGSRAAKAAKRRGEGDD